MALSNSRITTLGKFLALILRHDPKVADLTLDEHGWADVAKIVNNKPQPMSYEELKEVVSLDKKGRYTFNEDGSKVRASQGHSVSVDVQLALATDVPNVVFHGTSVDAVASILKEGLLPQSRLYVHLSVDQETATTVGKRHGKLAMFAIPTKPLIEAGFPIYVSENGVYQSKFVPAKFLAIVEV